MHTWFPSRDHREQAIRTLQAMPRHAKQLLATLVETQGFTRQSVSATIAKLEGAGFVICRKPSLWDPWFITPSLYEEEALLRLTIRERKARNEHECT